MFCVGCDVCTPVFMFSVYYGECTLVLVFCVDCEACTPVLMFCVGCGSAPWSLCFACIVWSALWPWTEPCSQSKLSCCLESFQISGSNTGIPIILSCIFLGSYYPRCPSGFPWFWWLLRFWGTLNKHGTECPWVGILLTLFLHDQTLILGRRQEK